MYDSNEVAKRIKEIAKIQNSSIKEILTKAGLSQNTLSNMKTSMPKADNLARIADCLHCSTDYLLSRTDTLDCKWSDKKNIDLTPEEQYLIDIYRKADKRGKRNILRMVQGEDQETGPSTSGTGFTNIIS